MAKRLRTLALVNVIIAVAFLMPMLFSVIADYQARGTLNVTIPKGDQSQEFIADIEATKDIDKLRHQAKTLVEMRKLEKDYGTLQSQLVQRLFQWLWMLATVCGAGFLVNAVAIWWIDKESRLVDVRVAL